MANDTVIRIEGIGKRYRLGQVVDTMFYEEVQRKWSKFRQRFGPSRRAIGANQTHVDDEFIWALKDINIEVKEGEILGVIGRNGAGKSTLLKLLSRITAPTCGNIEIDGRLASLLEVGTGFHPELTGRENIFLNGTILGMSKREIASKFDEIVAFAELEHFIDTPVKRYSSGMYVRLAFSVAAHLEPDILLVDEVLAVGDLTFQRKCLGKMEQVAEERGRTVILVSHQMDAIETLCHRVCQIENGQLQRCGGTHQVVTAYINETLESCKTIDINNRLDRRGDGRAAFTSLWMANGRGEPINAARAGKELRIYLSYSLRADVGSLDRVSVSLGIHDGRGKRVTTMSTDYLGVDLRIEDGGHICWHINKLPLHKGKYRCNVFMSSGDRKSVVDWVQDAFVLDVIEGDYYGSGAVVKHPDDVFYMDYEFIAGQN